MQSSSIEKVGRAPSLKTWPIKIRLYSLKRMTSTQGLPSCFSYQAKGTIYSVVFFTMKPTHLLITDSNGMLFISFTISRW
jgi:hypothetical protein